MSIGNEDLSQSRMKAKGSDPPCTFRNSDNTKIISSGPSFSILGPKLQLFDCSEEL